MRIWVSAGFIVLSIAAIGAAVLVGAGTGTGNVLINVGTEIFGLVITLTVVDLLIERRRLEERGREIAWSALHEIERVIWVWQGGPRRVGTDELLGLISAISRSAAPEPFTRALLSNLGHRCREILNLEPKAVRTMPGLATAAKELSCLADLSSREDSSTHAMVMEALEHGTSELCRELGQPAQKIPAGLVRQRDASPEGQRERYYAEAGISEARRPVEIVSGAPSDRPRSQQKR
jgi:hypothetical protein